MNFDLICHVGYHALCFGYDEIEIYAPYFFLDYRMIGYKLNYRKNAFGDQWFFGGSFIYKPIKRVGGE